VWVEKIGVQEAIFKIQNVVYGEQMNFARIEWQKENTRG